MSRLGVLKMLTGILDIYAHNSSLRFKHTDVNVLVATQLLCTMLPPACFTGFSENITVDNVQAASTSW